MEDGPDQIRGWLPDPIGGLSWFGVDDTFTTVWFPVYAGITEIPYSYRVGTGSYHEVDYDAAFWAFNRVANYAYSRYSGETGDMVVDRWNQLFDELLYKYLDGNVKNEFGEPQFEGYPEEWLRTIVTATGERYAMVEVEAETERRVVQEEAARREAEALAASIVILLEARWRVLDPAQRERIETEEDLDQLRSWLLLAAEASSVAEVLADGEARP